MRYYAPMLTDDQILAAAGLAVIVAGICLWVALRNGDEPPDPEAEGA